MTTGRKTPVERKAAYESARLVGARAWAFVGCALAFVIALVALGSVESAVHACSWVPSWDSSAAP